MKGLLSKHIPLIVLLVVSGFLIGFHFNKIPSHLAFDELQFAELSRGLVKQPYQVYSSEATGHATLYYYILAASMGTFGVTSFALRFPAAVFGIAAIFVVYGISTRIWKDQKIALLMPLILVSMRWYYTFARYSFEATFLLLLELVAVWTLLIFLKNKKPGLLFVSALCSGLTFHSYIPGRIFIFVPSAILLLFLYQKKIRLKDIIVYLAIACIVMLPLAMYLLQNPDIRVAQTSILSDTSTSIYEKISAIGSNIVVNTKMFVTHGDMNGRHNFPGKAAVSPILFLLSFTGLLISLKKRSMYDRIFLLYALIAMLPTLFTHPHENPHMLRTFTVLPSLAYFSTLAIHESIKRFTPYAQYLLIGGYMLVLVSLIYDARTYFSFQSRVMRNSFEVTCPLEQALTYNAEELGSIPPECRTTQNLY